MTQVSESPTNPGRARRSPADPGTPMTADELRRATESIGRVAETFSSRVVGQHRVRTALLVTLLSEGHILLESVPGLAKTLAASTLAHAVSARFTRIQCTPDLLPADIIGTQVYDPRRHEFETQLGPVHANVVLLDEINRASAKTQSALLEAMQERQTSIAGTVHPLPDPFMVLATQNPIEEEGTYVLPHAQMDRFLLKEVVDYPTEDDELMVLERIDDGTLGQHMTEVEPVITTTEVAELQELVRRVYVDPAIRRYVVALVRATRDVSSLLGAELGNYVEIGSSPRGSIAFFQAARAMAVVQGRHYVIPEDIRELRHSVLRHRIHLSFEALADRVRPETVIDAVFRAVPPRERGMTAHLTRIRSRLAIHAHRRVRGLLEGEYAAIHAGRGIDFNDLREYVPGDDVKDIDWKASARSRQILVKRYVAERKHTVLLCISTGRSMAAMNDAAVAKRELAVLVAGVLGHLAVQHGDLVALVHGNAEACHSERPRGGDLHLERLLGAAYDAIRPDGPPGDLATLLRHVVRTVRRRTILVVVTDETALADDAVALLRRLTVQHEVLFVTLGDLDPTLPAVADRRLVDVDMGAEVPAWLRHDEQLRREYAALVDDEAQRLRRRLDQLGIAQELVRDHDDAITAVFRLLERHRHARR